MNPFLIIVLELLPLAIKIVERWVEADTSEANKREQAVKDIMAEGQCKENEARAAVELGVGSRKVYGDPGAAGGVGGSTNVT